MGNAALADLARAILAKKEEARASEHRAVVDRIGQDGTYWVKIPGGADETPISSALVEAEPGDTVVVDIANGRAVMSGNVTSPVATTKTVGEVSEVAEDAAEAAASALGSADAAASAARRADASATVASTAASSALVQLSVVEDVAGTLAWIQEHGTFEAASDTQVVEGRVYFEYDSQTGDYTPIAKPDPEANPHDEGWYVLDVSDSQTDFIMAHLAITSRGLWVLPSGIGSSTTPSPGESQADSDARQGSGYKALYAADGTSVYDGSGKLVVKFGDSVLIGSTGRPFFFGTDDAYIVFHDTNSDGVADKITIGGDVSIGDTRSLSDLLAALNEPEYDHYYEYSNGLYTFHAQVFKHGEDVTALYDPEFFVWYLRTESGGDTFLGTGATVTVTATQVGYRGSVLGGLQDALDWALVDDGGATMVVSGGEDVAIHVIWEV